ncbi:MAG: hypothetical protein JWO67_5382 [Streptosporangiaceae bacterium]|nr:hypothetical protein [Streptosporangiaceae bacterium]
MTTPPAAPFTPTIVLNMADNPLVVYLERQAGGQMIWQLRMDTGALADRETIKQVILELNQFTTRWFFETYGFHPPAAA